MWILLLLGIAYSYLPGVSQEEYSKGSPLRLYVKRLDSSLTQIPYDYYYLKYCKPQSVKKESENIGEELAGNLLENSPYKINMQMTNKCSKLCTTHNSPNDIRNFRWMIDYNYKASWMLDSLPAGLHKTFKSELKKYLIYEDGFPVGFKRNNEYYINNHHNLIIEVTPSSDKIWSVVGFLVEPLSLNNKESIKCNQSYFESTFFSKENYTEEIFYADIKMVTDLDESSLQKLEENITFTYSVIFKQSNIRWNTRWDHYFLMSNKSKEVHWLGLVNSFAMVLLLSGMVGTILRRSIHRDVNNYNDSIDYEDESGWKQVRSDVFRGPIYASLFSIIIGTGVQMICMLSLTLFFTSLGFLSPEHRGAFVVTAIVLFVFMGIFAGYTSARFYKLFGGLSWKKNALGTSMIFPGICFSVFFTINFFLKLYESSGAASFKVLLELVVLWFGVSVPLVFTGAFIGFSKPVIANPSKVSKIPKPIQLIPGLNKIKLVGLLAGCLPFGSMFIELSYVMQSLWHPNMFYYLFGFLFLCFIVLIITSAEVSILLSYILLCREDYRWWWLSVMVAGSSGGYLFAYSVIYWFLYLEVGILSSIVLYFGYMFLASLAFAIITGTIGFVASFVFIRTIFSMIKIE